MNGDVGPDQLSGALDPRLEELLRGAGVLAHDGEGESATEPQYRFDVEHTVGLLAGTLARLHAIDPASADRADADGRLPRLGPDALVERARRRLAADGSVAEPLDEAYGHIQPARLVEILDESREQGLRGGTGSLVLTHGRPVLGALRCAHGAAIGFTGWQRLALADPYRDLAVAARSVATALGPMLVPTLFDRYTAVADELCAATFPADPLRLDWYALAAELDP